MNDLEQEIYTGVMNNILKQIGKHAFIFEGHVRNMSFGSAKEVNISQSFDCICCEITIPAKKNYTWNGDLDRFVIRIIVHEYIHVLNWFGCNTKCEKYNYWLLTDPKSIDEAINVINKCLKLIKTL